MTLKKVLLLILIGLVISALLIAGIFFFFINKDSSEEEVVVKEVYLYQINELYTNIKDSNNIMKTSITLEYTDKKLLESLEMNKAKITNDILELLRNKKLDELSGKTGQQSARNDILSLVRGVINSENISNIYFTEFIIQ